MNYDIVVVGGGIVGCALGWGLAQLNTEKKLRLALVEKNQAKGSYGGAQFDPRVVALNQHSIDFFKRLSIWPSIEAARVCQYKKMHVWDGEGTGAISFDARETHAPFLGAIVENSVVNNCLVSELNQSAHIDCLWQNQVETVNRLDEGFELVLLSGEIIRTKVILAADGGNSPIRAQLGFQTREWDYHQAAIITTVESELSHQFTAWQRFSHVGPLAFLPLSDSGSSQHSSIVWSLDNEQAEKLMRLDDAAFCWALERTFERRLGGIEAAAERYVIPLKQLHAKHYVQVGAALVGDAAHRIHPLAGQGVNLGLSDVEILLGEFARAIERDIPLRHFSILKRYQRQRMPHNLSAMAAMEGFKRLFGHNNLASLALRNAGLSTVDGIPPLKRELIKVAQGYI